MSSAVAIPWKRMRELEARLESFEAPKRMEITFQDAKSGKKLKVGGIWSPIKNRYLTSKEISELKQEQQIELGKQRARLIKLSQPQWRFAIHALEGALNDYRAETLDELPLQILLLHGARRAGKSVALFAAVLMIALVKPGSNIWVVGLRKRHGRKIMNRVQRALHRRCWEYDAYNDIMSLVNCTVIEAKSQVNYDSDVGDELDLLALDEAAIMREKVFDKLFPSVSNRNGFVAMASSPREFNWFYDKAELIDSQDEVAAETVRVVSLKPEDNIFAPIVKKRAELARHVMGIDEWKQEMMGEFLQKTGLVLPGFEKGSNVIPAHLMPGDATADVGAAIWRGNPDIEYIISVDYNINPTVGAVFKFDDFGRPWLIDEIITDEPTEVWGRMVEAYLRERGCADPFHSALIVGDASGNWQDPRDKKNMKSSEILKAVGFKVFRPCFRSKKNPGRVDRMQVMRSLVRNAADEPRFFVDPRCVEIIRALRTIPVNHRGHHDTRHKAAHYYDAASYAPWRVWGDTIGNRSIGQRVFKTSLVIAKSYEEAIVDTSRVDKRSKKR